MKATFRIPRGLFVAALSTFAFSAPTARAVLLNSTYEAQIETWLGLGDVTFTSIYNQSGAGMSNTGFHAAADGQGPTVSLLSIGAYDNYWNTPNQIIGGYNPQSWNSSNGYNITYPDAQRSAFIFNLTYNRVQRQNLSGEGAASYVGQYQTYNSNGYGPTFGGGHDIYSDLSSTSAYSYAYNYSYGGTSFLQPITSGATDSNAAFDYFRISEIEVLTFTLVPNNGGDNAVSDGAATLCLLGPGLLGLGALRRRA